jgi:hypothetical protein
MGEFSPDDVKTEDSVPSVCVSSPRLIVPLKVESAVGDAPHLGATNPVRETTPVTLWAPQGSMAASSIAAASGALYFMLDSILVRISYCEVLSVTVSVSR